MDGIQGAGGGNYKVFADGTPCFITVRPKPQADPSTRAGDIGKPSIPAGLNKAAGDSFSTTKTAGSEQTAELKSAAKASGNGIGHFLAGLFKSLAAAVLIGPALVLGLLVGLANADNNLDSTKWPNPLDGLSLLAKSAGESFKNAFSEHAKKA